MKHTDADGALLKWKAFTKNGQGQRIIQHYMIVSNKEPQRFNVVQCYPTTWDISSTIIAGLTRAQAEYRVSRVIERSDCEVV